MKTKLAAALLTVIALTAFLHMRKPPETYTAVCFSSSCVNVEVADTPFKRQLGLMHRESLPPDHGMLFVFGEEGLRPFWMKNTLIPLDIIWMDSDLEVVHIEHATPCRGDPCTTYAPQAHARYVLEVNAGYAAEHDIKAGDTAALR